MEEFLAELAEPLALVAYALIAAALTVVGIGLELAGLSGVATGFDIHTVWLIYVGVVALAAAGVVTKDKLAPAVRAR